MNIRYLAIPVIIYYAYFLTGNVLLEKDSASYALLGENIARSAGYYDYFLPDPAPHTFFPPGYPFILSIVLRFFGRSLFFLRLATVLMAGCAILVMTGLLRKLKEKYILPIFILFSLNSLFLNFTHTITSEAAYLLFSWSAIYLILDDEKRSAAGKLIPGLLLAIIAFYTRTIGITLYVSIFVYLWAEKRFREALLAGLLGLLILPWAGYLFIKGGGYTQVFFMRNVYDASAGIIKSADIPLRILSNLKYYTGKVTSDLLFFPYFKEVTFGNILLPVKVALSALFTFLFSYGFISSVRKLRRLTDIYVLVYLSALLFWPFHDERFLLPVYPFLLGYLFVPVKWGFMKALRLSAISLLFIAVFFSNIESVMNLADKKNNPGRPFLETALWIKNNTPPEAVIISPDPVKVYYYTGRRGLPLEVRTASPKAIAKIRETKADYLLIDRSFAFREEDWPSRGLELSYKYPEDPGMSIYKIIEGPGKQRW